MQDIRKARLKRRLMASCVVLLPIIILGTINTFYLFFTFDSPKRFEVYGSTLKTISQNSEVISVLGEPLEFGSSVSTITGIANSVEEMQMTISISGPKGKGVIWVNAQRKELQWSIDRIEVRIEGKEDTVVLK